jgi:hypothetical protein
VLAPEFCTDLCNAKKETYFVSSTSASAKDKDKDKDTTHFIGRKIAPVPIPPKRFVLIKQSLPVLCLAHVKIAF